MALLRYSPDLDPVTNLITLQGDLERFLRNPGYGLGVSGSGGFPPVNIFDAGDGIAVIAEVPGIDPEEHQRVRPGSYARLSRASGDARPRPRRQAITAASDRSVSFRARSNCRSSSISTRLPRVTTLEF